MLISFVIRELYNVCVCVCVRNEDDDVPFIVVMDGKEGPSLCTFIYNDFATFFSPLLFLFGLLGEASKKSRAHTQPHRTQTIIFLMDWGVLKEYLQENYLI